MWRNSPGGSGGSTTEPASDRWGFFCDRHGNATTPWGSFFGVEVGVPAMTTSCTACGLYFVVPDLFKKLRWLTVAKSVPRHPTESALLPSASAPKGKLTGRYFTKSHLKYIQNQWVMNISGGAKTFLYSCISILLRPTVTAEQKSSQSNGSCAAFEMPVDSPSCLVYAENQLADMCRKRDSSYVQKTERPVCSEK